MEHDLKQKNEKNEDDIKKTFFLDSSLIKGQTFPGIGSALSDFLNKNAKIIDWNHYLPRWENTRGIYFLFLSFELIGPGCMTIKAFHMIKLKLS